MARGQDQRRGYPAGPAPAPPLFPQLTASLQPWQTLPSRLAAFLILNPTIAVFQALQAFILSPRTHRAALRVSLLAAISSVAALIAIAAYVGFYTAWVPEVGLRKDVWLQYGFSQPPFAVVEFEPAGQFFAEDQPYDVTLELSVPLSAANIDLGNFMVDLDLRGANNRTVIHASRPTILLHEPAPIRALSVLSSVLSRNPPSALPSPATQILSVQLLRRAILQPSSTALPLSGSNPEDDPRIVSGRVTVGRWDQDKYWIHGGGHGAGALMRPGEAVYRSRGELQTHGASLRFDAHLTGLRYFMYHHPLLSFILFTSLFFGAELLSAMTLWAAITLYTSAFASQPSLAVEENYVSIDAESAKRRRLAASRVSSEATLSPPDSHAGLGSDEQTSDEEMRRQASAASLAARDATERAERRRAEARRDAREGRRMSGVDAPTGTEPGGVGLGADLEERARLLGLDTLGPAPGAGGRRVLGRLDEETEEDTDVGSRTQDEEEYDQQEAAMAGEEQGWEDLGPEERTLRMRKGPGAGSRQSTVGGSATSRASSMRSLGTFRTGSSGPGAPSTTDTPTARGSSAAPAGSETEESDLDGDADADVRAREEPSRAGRAPLERTDSSATTTSASVSSSGAGAGTGSAGAGVGASGSSRDGEAEGDGEGGAEEDSSGFDASVEREGNGSDTEGEK